LGDSLTVAALIPLIAAFPEAAEIHRLIRLEERGGRSPDTPNESG